MKNSVARVIRGIRAPRGVLALAVAGVVVLSACSSAAASVQAPSATGGTNATASLTNAQVSDAGQVSISVTWNRPDSGPVFDVAMNTHSVDLDNLDLTQLAVLETPAGEQHPVSWDAPRGGHHRSGTLTFAPITPDGSPTLGSGPVRLVFRDVAGIPERTFQWQP